MYDEKGKGGENFKSLSFEKPRRKSKQTFIGTDLLLVLPTENYNKIHLAMCCLRTFSLANVFWQM